ncbi:MAG: hypothetical protein Q9212_007185, partial [Teloschistes hypoglaucus]
MPIPNTPPFISDLDDLQTIIILRIWLDYDPEKHNCRVYKKALDFVEISKFINWSGNGNNASPEDIANAWIKINQDYYLRKKDLAAYNAPKPFPGDFSLLKQWDDDVRARKLPWPSALGEQEERQFDYERFRAQRAEADKSVSSDEEIKLNRELEEEVEQRIGRLRGLIAD